MRTRPLGDLADLTVGHVGPMVSEYVESGVPFLRSLNIRPFRIDASDIKFISREFHERLKKSALRPGDVVVVRTGEPGTAALIPESLPEANCSDVVIVRPCPGLDPRYLAYLINGASRGFVNSRTVGAVQQHFNVGAARELPVPDLPLEEQRRIAGSLGALDDLIDTNRRIADGCTALWRAIVSDALADASESIPLSELADFVNGKNFTKEASERGRPVIRTPEVRRGPEAGTVRSDVDAADENIARQGDTLFVWSGSLTVGRWMWDEGLINQHVFKVLPKQDVPAWLVFALIEHQMPWFLSLAADKATTMGHIKREHLDAAVPVPLPTEIKRLGPIVEPLWNEALQCGIATQQLAHARDELLPLLLAGRVRVGDGAA